MQKSTLRPRLEPALQVRIHDLMVKTRCVEERMIKMNRDGEGFFWIGAPGEEAFGVPLGLQVKKGQGPDFDYLHLHYRSSPLIMAMGGTMLDSLRQMGMRATDRYSAGRNFTNHYAIPEWNVAPMAPTIETQYLIAPGTAWVQRRHGGDGITIVNGGDAGTAEGDFASCLIWSTRPGKEIPMLIIVVNNKFGISTSHGTQHGVRNIADRGIPHGMPTKVINGNDVFESWAAIDEAMRYVRTERRPYLLEAHVSRLNGHSSSSGANRVDELDCILEFEKQLLADKIRTEAEIKATWERWRDEANACVKQLRTEPFPEASDIWKWTFHNDADNTLAKAGGD